MPIWGTSWSPLSWIFGWRHAPPIAGGPLPFPDLFATPQQVQLAGGNLMDNNGFGADSDTDVGRAIFCKIENKGTAQGGSVTIHQDGTFVYTPPDGFSGTDFFTYTLLDDLLRSRNSTVNVIVNPVKQLTVSMSGGAVVWGTQIGDSLKLQLGKLLSPAFAGGGTMDTAISLHLVDYQGSAQMTASLFLYGEMGVPFTGRGNLTQFSPTYGLKVDMTAGGIFNCPGIFTADLAAAFTGGGSYATALVQPYFEMGVHFNGSGSRTTLGFLTTEHDFAIDFVAGGLLHTSTAYETAHPDEGDSLGLQAYTNLPTAFAGGGGLALNSGFVIGLEGTTYKGGGSVTIDGLVSTFLTVGLDGGAIMNLYGAGVLGNGNEFDPQHFVGGATMGVDVHIDPNLPVSYQGGGTLNVTSILAADLAAGFTGGAAMASPVTTITGPTMTTFARTTNKGGTSIATSSFTPAASKSILVAWCWSDAFNANWTMPAVNGVAWTAIAAASGNSSTQSNAGSFRAFYVPIADGLASVPSLSCVASAGSQCGVAIMEVTGVDKTNVIDNTVVHAGNGSSTVTTLVSGSLTTTHPTTMVLLLWGSASSGTGTPTSATGWTLAGGVAGASNPCFGAFSQYQSSALTSQVLSTGDGLNRWDSFAVPIRGFF